MQRVFILDQKVSNIANFMNDQDYSLRFLSRGRTVSRDLMSERMAAHLFPESQRNLPSRVLAAGFSRWAPGEGLERKNSDTWAFDLITHGEGIVSFDGQSHRVRAGQVVGSEKGSDLSFTAAPGHVLHKRFVVFDGPLAQHNAEFLGLFPNRILYPANVERAVAIMRDLYVQLRVKQEGFINNTASRLFELMLILADSSEPVFPEALNTAIAFIEENLDRSVDLDEIASSAQLSKRTCNRLFKKYFELSPMKYYEAKRLHRAQTLLSHTAAPIRHIASEMGYPNSHYFSTQFRKAFALTPREYRARTMRTCRPVQKETI